MPAHDLILVLDFGSQYTQLIARRIRELGVYSEIKSAYTPFPEIMALRPHGIVLSGGPRSVYEEQAPSAEQRLTWQQRRPVISTFTCGPKMRFISTLSLPRNSW